MELGIVARRDDLLTLLECKNAYYTVSVHKMWKSWDHIRSAGKQLDKRREIFSELANQSTLFKRLGWKANSNCVIHTGIVIANRVFHRGSFDGHPIRQAQELINVLTSGRIAAGNGPKEESLSFWHGRDFQIADLTAYLGPTSIASDQLGAIDTRSWRYSIGARDLIFSSYVLDMVKLGKELRERRGAPVKETRQRSSR